MTAFDKELQDFLDLAGPECEEAFLEEMDKIAGFFDNFVTRAKSLLGRAGKGGRTTVNVVKTPKVPGAKPPKPPGFEDFDIPKQVGPGVEGGVPKPKPLTDTSKTVSGPPPIRSPQKPDPFRVPSEGPSPLARTSAAERGAAPRPEITRRVKLEQPKPPPVDPPQSQTVTNQTTRRGAGDVSDEALMAARERLGRGTYTQDDVLLYTQNFDRAEDLARKASPPPNRKPSPDGAAPKPDSSATPPPPSPEDAGQAAADVGKSLTERGADAVRGATGAAKERLQQFQGLLDDVIKNPTQEKLTQLRARLVEIGEDPSIIGRAIGEKVEQVGTGARAVTEAVESVRFGVSPEVVGKVKNIRANADEYASIIRQLDELAPVMKDGKLTQTRKATSRVPGFGATKGAVEAEQKLVDDLVARRDQIAATMRANAEDVGQLSGTVDDFLRNPSQDALSRLGADDIFRTAGGTPMDPQAAALIQDVVERIIPPVGAAKGADDAAAGLASALKDMDPAYLAAAAGATGLGVGMAVG